MKQQVSIDRTGRLVIPKFVRQALVIQGCAELEIEVVGGHAQLSPTAPSPGPTEQRDGRLVYSGPLPDDWDSGEAISRLREERLRR